MSDAKFTFFQTLGETSNVLRYGEDDGDDLDKPLDLSGVHSTCGLTNVSFGNPNRKLANRTFITSAISRTLDSAIPAPTDTQLYGAFKTSCVVAGRIDKAPPVKWWNYDLTGPRQGDLHYSATGKRCNIRKK